MDEILKRILEIRNEGISLLSAISIVIEEYNLDFDMIVEKLKSNKTFMDSLKFECLKLGILKEERQRTDISLETIFT